MTSIPLIVRHRFVLKDQNEFMSVALRNVDGSGFDNVLDAVAIWVRK